MNRNICRNAQEQEYRSEQTQGKYIGGAQEQEYRSAQEQELRMAQEHEYRRTHEPKYVGVHNRSKGVNKNRHMECTRTGI
jgi:hypothetical protein